MDRPNFRRCIYFTQSIRGLFQRYALYKFTFYFLTYYAVDPYERYSVYLQDCWIQNTIRFMRSLRVILSKMCQ